MRRSIGFIHFALAAVIIVAVCLQVYLIGAYVFGAGTGALDAHESVGFTTHAIEVLVLVAALAAWLPRPDLWLSLGLAVIGTLQITLAGSTKWVGALHPLLALLVLALAGLLVLRGLGRVRRAPTAAV